MSTVQSERSRLLNKAIVLTDEQVERYGDKLIPLPEEMFFQLNTATYAEDVQRLQNNSCDSFVPSGHGFTASITLERPGLVFFSVPYEAGWSASVNGSPAQVENVSVGFMAVWCEAGENEIVFDYMTPGLKLGGTLSIVALCMTAGWVYLGIRKKRKVA